MMYLEALSFLLKNAENQLSRPCEANQNDPAAKFCLVLCRKAVEELDQLVRQLENQITSAKRHWRTIAKYRVTLKKHLIEECHGKLQSAIQLLMLSQQIQNGYVSRLMNNLLCAFTYF